MSQGPIRELSAGPKPGGVSTFTKRLREEAKKARKKRRRREGRESKTHITCIYISGMKPKLVSGTEQ